MEFTKENFMEILAEECAAKGMWGDITELEVWDEVEDLQRSAELGWYDEDELREEVRKLVREAKVEWLFGIAAEEYAAAGMEVTAEGTGNWAYYSADDEYADEDEIREELREYIKEEQEIFE